MEWFTGLALLPALVCGVMMGGMALAGVLGWRRSQGDTRHTNADANTGTDTKGANEPQDAPPVIEDTRR